MIISIIVRDLNVNKHQINKYAFASIHFKEKNAVDEIVRTVITRKIHLIKNLEVNLLINNDIFDFELIDISTSTNLTHIKSCEIIISILIKTRFNLQQLSIYTFKTTIVLFEIELLLKIYNIFLSNRDYFFEFANTINFFIYVHVVNFEIKFILIKMKIFIR